MNEIVDETVVGAAGETAEEAPGTAIARRGLMLVLSSPSGAGKSTLSRLLLEADQALSMSVSVTTRPPRPGEVDGQDYHFVDAARFAEMREAGALLEWAEVFGNFYGTPREPVMMTLQAGRDALFDIDWQGAQQLSQRAGEDVVRVFILPPSAEVLKARLRDRNQDPEEVVRARMAGAAAEISHWPEYDYVIVNDRLEASMEGLRAILSAERLKRARLVGLTAFVREMQVALPRPFAAE